MAFADILAATADAYRRRLVAFHVEHLSPRPATAVAFGIPDARIVLADQHLAFRAGRVGTGPVLHARRIATGAEEQGDGSAANVSQSLRQVVHGYG